MHLGSDDVPVERPVAPTTRGGFAAVIIGLMVILLFLGAVAFLFLGKDDKVPLATKSTPTPSAASAATRSATPATPRPSFTPVTSSDLAGTCLVSAQIACEAALFADYQPATSAPFRAALLGLPLGAPIYAPAAGVVTAVETADFLDAQAQPIYIEGAFLEISTPDGVIYRFVFRQPLGTFVLGQEVRAGQLLGVIAGERFALASGPANLVFAILVPGAGGMPVVDGARMQTLFPAY